MAIKKYKPTSPGRRGMSVSAFDEITAKSPEKSLLAPKKKTGGRNAAAASRCGTLAAATGRNTE